MRKKEYFNIGFAQIKLNLDYDSQKEYLIADKMYFSQMKKIINYIDKNYFDIFIFPEMSYHPQFDDYFVKNSHQKIIVFGSVYIGNENFTVVYHNEHKFLIKKMFHSGVEPSIRFHQNITAKEFIKKYLKQHTFKLYGKKIVVLNCAEYYKVAYFVARDNLLNKNLFGFLVPCANNNSQVFFDESIAIHNHNENIYSFVVNSNSSYKNQPYSFGKSYIFGQITKYEKQNLANFQHNHASNICCLDDDSYLVEGMFLFNNNNKYLRSDGFCHTPKNFKIKKLGDI